VASVAQLTSLPIPGAVLARCYVFKRTIIIDLWNL
jgi:hypothetical protein